METYRSRRWQWAKRAARERLGSQPVVAATFGVPSFSGIAALVAAGSLSLFTLIVGVAVAAIGFLVFAGLMLVYSWVVAPGELAAADAHSHRKIADDLEGLRDSLRPRFRLTPSAVNESPGHPAIAMLTVECLGNAQARNCRGRLVGMGTERSRRAIDVPLAWAQPDDPSDPSRKTFYGAARLDVARGGHNPNYILPASAQPLDVIDHRSAQLARDHETLLCVEVTADDTPPVREWFRLRWWSYIVSRDKETGQDTMYDLRYDNIVFVPEAESTRKPGVGDDEYS
jgi:hypothetical protein